MAGWSVPSDSTIWKNWIHIINSLRGGEYDNCSVLGLCSMRLNLVKLSVCCNVAQLCTRWCFSLCSIGAPPISPIQKSTDLHEWQTFLSNTMSRNSLFSNVHLFRSHVQYCEQQPSQSCEWNPPKTNAKKNSSQAVLKWLRYLVNVVTLSIAVGDLCAGRNTMAQKMNMAKYVLII